MRNAECGWSRRDGGGIRKYAGWPDFGLWTLHFGLRHCAIAEDHVVLGADLFNDDWRWHFIVLHRFGIHHYHAFGGGKPKPAIGNFPGWVLEAAAGFAARHPVGLPVSHALDSAGGLLGDVVGQNEPGRHSEPPGEGKREDLCWHNLAVRHLSDASWEA